MREATIEVSFARFLTLGAAALLACGCASTSEFAAYRTIEEGEVRDERIFVSCRDYARRVVRGAARGPIENSQDRKERLASSVGSGIGDRILFSRAVDRCMKENGYVRGHEKNV